jgi:phosphoglycerate dehydrogenase-like enzyme
MSLRSTLHILVLQQDLPVEWDVLENLSGCSIQSASCDEEALPLAPLADVVVVGFGGGGMLRRLWPHFQKVRWIHAMSAGVDWIMFDGLRGSPLPFTNARGVYAPALAEFAMLGLLHFAKDVPRLTAQKTAHEWKPFLVDELRDATLAVVGYGGIGRAASRLAHAFGMRVTAVKRHLDKGMRDPWVSAVSDLAGMRDVLRAADHALLCLPHTAETFHIVGAPELACLRPHGVLVNVGRGTAVVEDALVASLRGGGIRGAALDVFETEPLPPDSPFYSLPNVLLSPHCADRTARWQKESATLLRDNVERFQRGEPLLNVVDKALGY